MAIRKNLKRCNVQKKIQGNKHKLFSTTFRKQDGSLRKMVAIHGAKIDLKGGQNNVEADDRAYVTVFDVKSKGYRTINIDTMTSLKMGGVQYDVIA